MPTLTAHRFQLQPYAGPKSRTTCPSCGTTRCFTRYLDTDTGELLPDEYGRCDREANCGYVLSPYTRPAGGGLSYATAAEREEALPTRPAPVRPTPKASPPVVSIPPDVYRASLGHYERNALAQLLRQHFGAGVADELLSRFRLGTSAYWPGACVFWLLDEQQQVRGGQVVLYDETGHTVKKPRRHTTWAHTALTAASQRRGEAPPDWLADYEVHGQKSPCLFGLPQLATAPTTQPVALVESAKTAILATPYFPRYIWLATMGLSYLTPDRLEPLRGRRLVLFPDAGALDKWQAKADQLRRLGFDVQVSNELEKLATNEERRAGLDLADVLLREWPGYPPNWDE
ncbi:MAG: DUF6371 domain-containing protein [Janthinobacterium lividum]